jgi:hypothetical protein
MGLGVREVEHPAEHVADLVVHTGAGARERDRREIGAVQGLLDAVEARRVGLHQRQARGQLR